MYLKGGIFITGKTFDTIKQLKNENFRQNDAVFIKSTCKYVVKKGAKWISIVEFYNLK